MQAWEHLGGGLVFSTPQGTTLTVFSHAHLSSTVNGHGRQGPSGISIRCTFGDLTHRCDKELDTCGFHTAAFGYRFLHMEDSCPHNTKINSSIFQTFAVKC
jgi:hypothetical protein